MADEAVKVWSFKRLFKAYFCTGSRVYGTPREDSDIDVVALIDERNFDKKFSLLWQQSDDLQEELKGNPAGSYIYEPDDHSLRFGKLNLLCFYHKMKFDAWHAGTQHLICLRPVTRDFAVEVLEDREEQYVEEYHKNLQFEHYADQAFRKLADVFANL